MGIEGGRGFHNRFGGEEVEMSCGADRLISTLSSSDMGGWCWPLGIYKGLEECEGNVSYETWRFGAFFFWFI